MKDKMLKSNKGNKCSYNVSPSSSDSDEGIVIQVGKRSKALSDIQIITRNKSINYDIWHSSSFIKYFTSFVFKALSLLEVPLI